MIPVDFDESNSTLIGIEVEDLPTFKDGEKIISAWKPTLRERFSILFHGVVWLYVHTPKTHSPVSIIGSKTVFEGK